MTVHGTYVCAEFEVKEALVVIAVVHDKMFNIPRIRRKMKF